MASFPPSGPPMSKVLRSYLYVQYNDDADLQAFVDSYNNMAQAYMDAFTGLNLPVYTSGNISGALLDWVAEGVYGLARPGLPIAGTPAQGPLGTFLLGGIPVAGYVPPQGQTFYATSDDIFKRVITWYFYKGDGKVCSVPWLKRRIARFLSGQDGTAPSIDATPSISVSFPAPYQGLIRIPASPEATIFQAAVASGALELPFQWTWTVETWTPDFPFLLDSNSQLITDSGGFPIVGS